MFSDEQITTRSDRFFDFIHYFTRILNMMKRGRQYKAIILLLFIFSFFERKHRKVTFYIFHFILSLRNIRLKHINSSQSKRFCKYFRDQSISATYISTNTNFQFFISKSFFELIRSMLGPSQRTTQICFLILNFRHRRINKFT